MKTKNLESYCLTYSILGYRYLQNGERPYHIPMSNVHKLQNGTHLANSMYNVLKFTVRLEGLAAYQRIELEQVRPAHVRFFFGNMNLVRTDGIPW
jgi:hypothetical protein